MRPREGEERGEGYDAWTRGEGPRQRKNEQGVARGREGGARGARRGRGEREAGKAEIFTGRRKTHRRGRATQRSPGGVGAAEGQAGRKGQWTGCEAEVGGTGADSAKGQQRSGWGTGVQMKNQQGRDEGSRGDERG